MKLEALSLDHDRMPALELRCPGYKPILAKPGEDFQIALSGWGFDVTRPLTVDDLREIRDWCDRAIEQTEAIAVAAE